MSLATTERGALLCYDGNMMIRLLTEVGYQKIVKPMLFRHQPDTVHKGLIATARRVQAVPVVRQLPKLWAVRNSMLEIEVAGVRYKNPVGLSAGFDKRIEMVPLMKSVGFGWMTGGSVTLGQYDGNEGNWYFRLPKTKSIVVNAGLPSEGTPVVAERVANYPTSLFVDFPLNVSVAKTNSKKTASETHAIKDYAKSLEAFDRLNQVAMLEINISCPNTFGGEPFTTPARLEALLAATDKLKLQKPVYIKMPINLPDKDFDELVNVIVKHHVAGVAIGNLYKDRQTAQLLDELPDDIKGNLSGVPTRQVTTELIARTYKRHGDKLSIIGIGGIMSAEDAYEKIRAGASLVALISSLMFEGPQVVGDINAGLVKLLKRDGYASIADAVGQSAIL